ncbi:hypothetical protein ACFWN2_13950 [Lentzea sp. NPDC058436]|uniref:hypothetical protein n=1 Tax=Lentzea sp. NPDC058436 TaxID=3346499 RepID=UPI003648DE41
MSRIEWTRMSGDDIEEMLAVMLLRDYPHGRHVKANPGDGGIDVFVPNQPGGSIGTNYQIKRFAEKISDSQKDQIRGSLTALQQTAAAGQFIATHCYIVVPLLPTGTDYSWLDNYSQKFEFDAEWYSLTHIEGLVSKYPEVVDYYLNDRAEHFTNAANNLIDLVRESLSMGLANESSVDISPADVASHLAKLEKHLNQDPFYEYHFRTSPTEPDFVERDGIVATYSAQFSDRTYIAVDLYARFEDAVHIRPCKVKFRAAPANDAEREQLDAFARFGTPAEVTATSVDVDFPGGLGGKFPSAMISFTPTPVGKPTVFKYEILRADGTVVSENLLETLYASRGAREPNRSLKVTDLNRVFTIEWRFDIANKTTSMNIKWSSIVGRVAAEILSSLHFLAHLEDGISLKISDRYVPLKTSILPFPSFSQPTLWKSAYKVVSDLVAIQGVADRQILVPDPAELDQDTVDEILVCARLARGLEVRGTWTSLEGNPVGPDFDISPFQEPASLRASGIRELTIGSNVYILGEAEVLHESAVLELGPEGNNGLRPARFVPGTSNNFVMRLISRSERPSP